MSGEVFAAEHVGGCNELCDGDSHWLLPTWEAKAERLSLVAEAGMWTARARLAVRHAQTAMQDGTR